MSSKRQATAIALALSAAALGWAPGPAQAQAPRTDAPVSIPSGDGQMANCSLGRIFGLDPKGDGFLSVRSGPGGQPYREIDRLYNGQEVLMCDRRGAWVGVVYRGSRPAPPHCGVEAARPARWAYTGPCPHGWVHQRYVRHVAG